MKLIPFAPEHLEVGGSLPFDLYDAAGRLMMPRDAVIQDATQLGRLTAHDLMADEDQSAEWRLAKQRERELAEAFDDAFRPAAPAAPAEPPAPPRLELIAELNLVQTQLNALLLEVAPDDKWLPRVLAVAGRMKELMDEHADAMLFLVLQRAVRRYEHYSSRHSLLCAMVSALCARQLGFTAR